MKSISKFLFYDIIVWIYINSYWIVELTIIIFRSIDMDIKDEKEDSDNLDSKSGFDSTTEVESSEEKDAIVIAHDEEEDYLDSLRLDLASQISAEMEDAASEENGKKKRYRWLKVTGIVFACIASFMLVMIATPWGRTSLKKLAVYAATEYAYGKMEYDDGSDVTVQDVVDDVDIDVDKIDQEDELKILWGNSFLNNGARHEDYVVNILLLGEEAIGSGTSRGRTDLMMIASLNIEDKSLKLTSLMRDTLVQIPDYEGKSYADNKLNTAYEIGGIPLMYETIALNFDIALDGYILVNFDKFEEIIDILDGVEVTLSESEARYLNSTNYISDPANRNVVAGTQVLNGNQALGFCRIRHVATIDNQHYDYGRTSRQRVVLNAIFDKCKEKSEFELVNLMTQIIPHVTTDITKEQFRNYLELGLELNIQEIENLRVPVDDTFEEGYVRSMAVLIPDLEANVEALHTFIFGNVEDDGTIVEELTQ